ncbi:MAG TPA: O-antigen ligase family protein [Mycobacteriales bacterium]|nr:O-antigen ligase family protein [Mycobacteriales bacterium]
MGLVTAVLVVAALPLVAACTLHAARKPLLVLLPAYAATVPFGNGLAVPGLPESVFSGSSLTGLLLTVVLACDLVFGRRGPRRVPVAVLAWLAFVALAGTTVYWSLSTLTTLEDFVTTLFVLALYVVVRLSDVDETVLSRLELGILAGGLAASAYGLYQFLTGTFVVGVAGDVRFGRDLIDPNHLAANLLLPLAIAMARGTAQGRPARRAGYLLLAALLLVAIVLTGSRGGVLGVGAVLIALALVSTRPVRVLLSGAAVVEEPVVDGARHGEDERTDRADDGDSGRTGVWQVGLNGCEKYCLAGSGWGTFPVVYAEFLPRTPGAKVLRDPQMGAHNIYLGAAVEAGLVGLLLLVTALALTVREALTIPRRYRGPPVAALAGLLFSSMLLGNLRFKYFWLVLLYVGVAHTVAARRRAGEPVDAPARTPADAR